jgi:hypothetical protein
LLLLAGVVDPGAYGQISSAVAKTVQPNLKSAHPHALVRGGRQLRLQLFFTNPNHPDFATTCGAGEFVQRKIRPTKRLADTALRLLFAGPTAKEKAKGMESLARLRRYYLGVSIRRGVAIINFRPGAREHLEGTACEQEQTLTPMDKTLKQFGGIKSVEYAINGKIIEEWDA